MSWVKILKALKYSTLGFGAVGTGILLHKNDWEISTIGALRFGRAALAVRIPFSLSML